MIPCGNGFADPAQCPAVCLAPLGGDSLAPHALITCFMKINETLIFLHRLPCLILMYLFRKCGRPLKGVLLVWFTLDHVWSLRRIKQGWEVHCSVPAEQPWVGEDSLESVVELVFLDTKVQVVGIMISRGQLGPVWPFSSSTETPYLSEAGFQVCCCYWYR